MSDSAPASVIARGAATEPPRPMKRIRSVSNEISVGVGSVHGHQMKHPRHVLFERSVDGECKELRAVPA